MANVEGVNVVISGDNSKLLRSVQESQAALSSMLAFNVGDKLSQGFGTMLSTLAGALQRVAGAVSNVMKSALSVGGGFEAQITNVKVISGATEQELDMLIKKAREMGATLPITAKDAATAMTLLAQRGTNAKDILASVADVANLAISQGIDMGSAADLLGSTMSNFGINIDDAARVTAIFNNASNQSALTMSKLTEAMKYVGPAAGALKMELTEAIAAMEAVAAAGLNGEMIGTGFNVVLTKLSTSSHIFGVRTKELDGALRPLKDIFTELKEKGFGLAEAQAAFGTRGKLAGAKLVELSESLATNEERLKQWGSTQSAVDEKAKTFTNTMAALQSAVEELHIEIFEQIKEQSKGAVSGIAELTRTFSKWIGETQIAGKSLNAFIEGLGFKIPSDSGFEALLKRFDVQAFVDKVKDFGATLRSIGESIVGFFDKIKTPLTWLINNIDSFAAISFWGWILGKGLQIPVAVMSIAASFSQLYTALKSLTVLNLTSLATFLANPAVLIAAGTAGMAVYAASKINAAHEEIQKAIEEEKRYFSEQANADLTLPIEIETNFKTGFEELPKSWAKASDEVRAKSNATIDEIRGLFKNVLAEAVDYVSAKFPEMSEAFKDSASEINTALLMQITKALKGSEKDFEALPEHWRKVTERINALDKGLDKAGIDLYGITDKYRQLRQEVEKPIKKSETQSFFEELTASIYSITTNLSGEIERAKTFLSGSDGQLAVNISITQAQKKLEQFVKTIADKYAIPEDIVKASLLDKLDVLATKGNEAAESLINGFGGAGSSLETFLSNAQEAITYLGASPEQFMPALNQMMKGIQRIDPMTGKLTEKFKKAHEALKQWASTSFDQLTGRIQRLRRAVEGGFIDKSALEAEFNRVMPQLKLQVVNELQPQREQYRTEKDYQAVVASELISRISDLFGDVGMDMAVKMFNGQTGSEMGRAIVAEVERGFSGSSGTFKLNGVDVLQKGVDALSTLPQSISNAVQPYVVKLEQLNSHQAGTSISPTNDYSAVITAIVKEIQASSQANVSAVNSVTSAVTSVTSAVNSVENAVKSQNLSVGFDQNGITQAIKSGIEPLFTRIDQSSNVYQSASAGISNSIQGLSGNIDALKKSADSNISAMASLQSALSATPTSDNSQDFSTALNPLVSAVQNLSTALNTIQSLQQANSSAISEVTSAVHLVENAIKSMSTGNTYDIDINQEGFTVEKKSDADMLARATLNAFRAGIGNGGI